VDLSKIVIYADVFKLAQVIRNLVSNAMKFTPSNGRGVVDINLLQKSIIGPNVTYIYTQYNHYIYL
jgi:signal transduction histidine kinase